MIKVFTIIPQNMAQTSLLGSEICKNYCVPTFTGLYYWKRIYELQGWNEFSPHHLQITYMSAIPSCIVSLCCFMMIK